MLIWFWRCGGVQWWQFGCIFEFSSWKRNKTMFLSILCSHFKWTVINTLMCGMCLRIRSRAERNVQCSGWSIRSKFTSTKSYSFSTGFTVWSVGIGRGHCETNNSHSAWICNDCVVSLWKGKVPQLSLADDLWIENIPCELTALMIPKQLPITHYYPWCYILKLFP